MTAADHTPCTAESGGAALPRRTWLRTSLRRVSWLHLSLLGSATALHGCASGPSEASGSLGAGAGRDAPRPAVRGQNPLSVERDWLRSWFEGTPVAIQQKDEGALSVEVPLAFSFEPRRSTVKPALAAVLDKLAQSLRRTGALLPGLSAPPDPAGPPALALQRAGALRAHLLSRGVPLAQLGAPAATPAAAVQLRAELPPL